MIIDVFADFVCPWCYIGKRRLERALDQRPRKKLAVVWHPFQLNPWMPAEGMDRREYMTQKFNEAELKRLSDTVRKEGRTEGIEFRFDGIRCIPNTRAAHRLARYGAHLERQDEVVEALFRAYFLDGADLGKREVLLDIAEGVGIDRKDAGGYLEGAADSEILDREEEWAQRAGITGVPVFLFDRRLALMGAQETEAFFRAFDELRAIPIAPPAPAGWEID